VRSARLVSSGSVRRYAFAISSQAENKFSANARMPPLISAVRAESRSSRAAAPCSAACLALYRASYEMSHPPSPALTAVMCAASGSLSVSRTSGTSMVASPTTTSSLRPLPTTPPSHRRSNFLVEPYRRFMIREEDHLNGPQSEVSGKSSLLHSSAQLRLKPHLGNRGHRPARRLLVNLALRH